MALLRRTSLFLLTAGVTWAGSPPCARAQASTAHATVRRAENFRKEPNGEILARLQPGASLSVAGRKDKWLEVAVEGWVWARSLQVTKREGFDLVVSAPGGENLRQEPAGKILGHLAEGTLLDQVGRRPGWIHVRRQGWIWAASVSEVSSPGVSAGGGKGATAAPTPKATSGAGAAKPAAARPGGASTVGAGGAAILAAPDGDTVAHADAGTELQVVSRQGSWARVRLEGWTWLPRGDSTGASGDTVQVLTPTELKQHPQAYRGRLVSWRLQFISLEYAEKVRTDFFEGEPFLLTRFGGPEGPFVYVAIPTSKIEEMRGLIPLERIEVTGRVRTGASSLTGTPIIDLVSLKRVGKSP